MSDVTEPEVAQPSKAALWSGRVLTVLIGLLLLFSGIMKIVGGPDLEKGFEQLGLPPSIAVPLGVVEIACVLIYLFPRTTVLGAILLTGYLGGAICTHWRVGDLFVWQVVFALLVWLATALREPRLWAVFWRTSA